MCYGFLPARESLFRMWAAPHLVGTPGNYTSRKGGLWEHGMVSLQPQARRQFPENFRGHCFNGEPGSVGKGLSRENVWGNILSPPRLFPPLTLSYPSSPSGPCAPCMLSYSGLIPTPQDPCDCLPHTPEVHPPPCSQVTFLKHKSDPVPFQPKAGHGTPAWHCGPTSLPAHSSPSPSPSCQRATENRVSSTSSSPAEAVSSTRTEFLDSTAHLRACLTPLLPFPAP